MFEKIILNIFSVAEAIQERILAFSMEDVGYTSTILLALCSLPLFIKTIRDGHCRGISALFLWMWFLGEVFGIIYVLPLGKMPLILNYAVNTVLTLVILIYKIRKG